MSQIKLNQSIEKRSSLITYILLDIHGVLTDGNERKLFLSQMENKYGMDYTQHNSLWVSHIDNLDKNLEKGSDYIKVVNKTFQTHFSVSTYYSMFLQCIKVNTALIIKLENIGIKICIVSDNLPPIATGLNKIFGKNFQKYKKFYSFESGIMKREGMLKTVIKQLSVKPEQCLFIDDSSKNIEVAKELGITSFLFKTNKELFIELGKQ